MVERGSPISRPLAILETSSEERGDKRAPSGIFNGMDVVYREPSEKYYSTAECVGESFSSDSWMYRSCLYRNICFDMETNEFVLFQSPANREMENSKISDSHYVSSSLNTSVSLGGFVWNWKEKDKLRLKWSPKVFDNKLMSSGYYELMGDVVMIPFHPIAPQNIGHLMWDSLLPIYSLLAIFGLTESKLALLRYVLDGKPLLYSGEDQFAEGSERNYRKLLPLIGIPPSQFSSTSDAVLRLSEEQKSKYVCSPQGVAGIGYLTDHGGAGHGKLKSDYEQMHNYGRGPLLFSFRNFILKNTGKNLPNQLNSTLPLQVTFSIHSSGNRHRNLDFSSQISAVKQAFSNESVAVKSYQFSELSMVDEISIIARSSILVTACGGGAVSSMFLPRGASLIMFYAEPKERVANAKLDFDYMNNMGYARTHWLPTKNMNEKTSLDSLVQLIRNELEIMSLQ